MHPAGSPVLITVCRGLGAQLCIPDGYLVQVQVVGLCCASMGIVNAFSLYFSRSAARRHGRRPAVKQTQAGQLTFALFWVAPGFIW